MTVILWLSAFVCQDFGQGIASSSRCDLKSNLVAAGCAASSVESPISKMQVIEDRPLSNKAAGATQDVTQIKPQKVHITLRPGRFLSLVMRDGEWNPVLESKRPTQTSSKARNIDISPPCFPRWCKALHGEGASGGGLPRGSLLPHGPLLLHEWRPLPPEDAGQRPGRGHEPHHQQPAHGLWGFCGQADLAVHVHLPQRGREEPLLQVKRNTRWYWGHCQRCLLQLEQYDTDQNIWEAVNWDMWNKVSLFMNIFPKMSNYDFNTKLASFTCSSSFHRNLHPDVFVMQSLFWWLQCFCTLVLIWVAVYVCVWKVASLCRWCHFSEDITTLVKGLKWLPGAWSAAPNQPQVIVPSAGQH